jgi:hypothetical protein
VAQRATVANNTTNFNILSCNWLEQAAFIVAVKAAASKDVLVYV